MADDKTEDNSAEKEAIPVQPEVLLPKVERQAKIGRVLTIAVIFVSVLTMIAMGAGMFVMSSRIAELEQLVNTYNEEDDVDQQFDVLEDRLVALAEFRKSELKKIQLFTEELETLSTDCSLEKAEPFLAFLSQREQDFQVLIDTIQSGTNSLAGMNQGSRKWLEEHNKALADLKKMGVERQTKLESLL
jgi:Trp operon repressor